MSPFISLSHLVLRRRISKLQAHPDDPGLRDMSQAIPTEIILHILAYLKPIAFESLSPNRGPDSLEFLQRPLDIYNACLVCRAWHACAIVQLYSRVYLYTPHRIHLFYQTLRRKPLLGLLVRELIIFDNYRQTLPSYDNQSRKIHQRAYYQLVTKRVDNHFGERLQQEVLTIVSSCSASLSINLRSCAEHASENTFIRNVVFSESPTLNGTPGTHASPSLTLANHRLNKSTSLSSSWRSLQQLVLHDVNVTPSFIEHLPTSTPQLDTLNFTHSCFSPNRSATTVRMFTALNQIFTLRVLEFVRTPIIIEPCSCLLPSRLERFYLVDGIQPPPSVVIEKVVKSWVDPQTLPTTLRELAITPTEQDSEDFNMPLDIPSNITSLILFGHTGLLPYDPHYHYLSTFNYAFHCLEQNMPTLAFASLTSSRLTQLKIVLLHCSCLMCLKAEKGEDPLKELDICQEYEKVQKLCNLYSINLEVKEVDAWILSPSPQQLSKPQFQTHIIETAVLL
ncbi:unnamed protein product [Somion occarium]|uniref:F-box domain-containing protein n=1 Tax=Somion occarium TaxID=3059160 RepID=A0ABP1ECZ9_9APHY